MRRPAKARKTGGYLSFLSRLGTRHIRHPDVAVIIDDMYFAQAMIGLVTRSVENLEPVLLRACGCGAQYHEREDNEAATDLLIRLNF